MSACEETPSIGQGPLEPNELARRALGGCADSFTELAQQFRPRLLNLLKHRTGMALSDAEDIVQETLAKAFQHLERFDPRYRFSTWLYTIALRLAYDHSRQQRRRPVQVSLDAAELVPCQASVSMEVERQATMDNVWMTARSILTDSQYTALWLRYAEEMSTAEVAQAMKKSHIGVRVLLHRSRSLLSAELAKQGNAVSESRASRSRNH